MKKEKVIFIFLICNLIVTIIWTLFQYKSVILMRLNSDIKESNIELKYIEDKYILSEEELRNKLIIEKDSTIEFYANTFQINKDTLINLIKDNNELDIFNNNMDEVLLNYLLDLEKNNSELFDKTNNPCTETKEYMIALIKYWTTIYSDVDFKIAASIAQIESGYRSSHMLKKNNIFGGMSKNGLISYRNIEYGTLKYIKLLHDGYYSKGLNTVESIGKVYNPVYNENGEKVASPTWVENVNKMLNKFENYPESIDVGYLLQLKSN